MRPVFDTIAALRAFVRENPASAKKKTPFVVTENGKQKLVLAGNGDQAIAIVGRDLGFTVEALPVTDLIS